MTSYRIHCRPVCGCRCLLTLTKYLVEKTTCGSLAARMESEDERTSVDGGLSNWSLHGCFELLVLAYFHGSIPSRRQLQRDLHQATASLRVKLVLVIITFHEGFIFSRELCYGCVYVHVPTRYNVSSKFIVITLSSSIYRVHSLQRKQRITHDN